MSRLSKRAKQRARRRDSSPAALITKTAEEWLSMGTAPQDNFVFYRLLATGEKVKGCIDFCTPNAVWIYERDHGRGYYLPTHLFDGWRKVSPEQIIGIVPAERKKPPWGSRPSIME